MNKFKELIQLNVSSKIEHKNGLSYLSVPYAVGELRKAYDDVNITIHETLDGAYVFSQSPIAGGFVKVTVSAGGVSHTQPLPIMDYKNKSIPLDKMTSFDVNTSIARATVKAIAFGFGVGLYIYAGEDVPESDDDPKTAKELLEVDKALQTISANLGAKVVKGSEELIPTYEELSTLYNKQLDRVPLNHRDHFVKQLIDKKMTDKQKIDCKKYLEKLG